MLSKSGNDGRNQVIFMCLEEAVPQDHILRKIDAVIDFEFVYDLVKGLYSEEIGRPSIDPVILIKIMMIQHFFGIRSMRQTIREIELNMAYRWFLGMSMMDSVPHYSTISKNYERRFAGTGIFDDIFQEVLNQCAKQGMIRSEVIFMDSTHLKASANRNKKAKVEVEREAAAYLEELRQEVNQDRINHGKAPFDDPPASEPETVTLTKSTTDPDSGLFVKGEHDRCFAYGIQTACDRNGLVLGYEVVPGNTSDMASFYSVYNEVKGFEPLAIAMDAGYISGHIARQLIKDQIVPLLPYKRPLGKGGPYGKAAFVYDEYFDCYICPENQILRYGTTDRRGVRHYRSSREVCERCPVRAACFSSRAKNRIITRHIWEPYLEQAEDIRHTLDIRELYKERKQTIERVFADGKEKHRLRYTNYRGRTRVRDSVALTFACMNLLKLSRWLVRNGRLPFSRFIDLLFCHLYMLRDSLHHHIMPKYLPIPL